MEHELEHSAVRAGLCPTCGQDVERKSNVFFELGKGEIPGFVCIDEDCGAKWRDPDVE